LDTSFVAGDGVPESSPASAGSVTDFDTNNQEEGVDQANLVKSDGIYVYAACNDVLVVWEALPCTYITNYTLTTVVNPVTADGMGDPSMELSEPGFFVRKASIHGISLESQLLVLYREKYGPEEKELLGGKFAWKDASWFSMPLSFPSSQL
jgi:hypothetical protein